MYKIVQEEFLKQSQTEFRDRYHSSELKKALKIVASDEGQEGEENDEGKSFEEHILEEIELKESFQFLEKELELKVYN